MFPQIRLINDLEQLIFPGAKENSYQAKNPYHWRNIILVILIRHDFNSTAFFMVYN
jgi:hypothetical protein